MRLAGWGQWLSYRRLRPDRKSVHARFLRLSRNKLVLQFSLLLALAGTLLQSAWWVAANNLPISYVFVQQLWALGWRPIPEVRRLPPGHFTSGIGRQPKAHSGCTKT